LGTAGLFSNSDSIAKKYMDATKKSGESFWRLPLSEDIKKELKSPVADLKNVGGRYGGAISAALFLQKFAGNTPWIHVDIAGPARLDKAQEHLWLTLLGALCSGQCTELNPVPLVIDQNFTKALIRAIANEMIPRIVLIAWFNGFMTPAF
jgi:hypothetical protein